MELLHSLGSYRPAPRRQVGMTIGNFDGMHRGHQFIIKRLGDWCRATEGRSLLLTFEPHPEELFHPAAAPFRITPLPVKIALAQAAGVDIMVAQRFDEQFAAYTADEFVDELVGRVIAPRHIVIGPDATYGKNRGGGPDHLVDWGKRAGVDVEIAGELVLDGAAVRSTAVRQALAQGAIELANSQLGHPYIVCGTTVRGNGRGHKLGFATANLELSYPPLVPNGVYATRTVIGAPQAPRERWDSVTYVGRNLTFGESSVVVETHLLDWAGDLYGCALGIELWSLLRREERFSSPGALVRQIAADIGKAREVLPTIRSLLDPFNVEPITAPCKP
ncbi:MAG: riboflavin biosynthesis protein RibF [Candidatus Schekmanbacteria bacterium]|nr:riboflavin biosynthesis protein RibF [Candidatus Schekmanbacteria bacterium]